MPKHRVAVLKVVFAQLSVTAAAAEYGFSRQHLQRLLRRYREGGLETVEPRSRRSRSSAGRTPEPVRERIIALRTGLTGRGLDAGPVTVVILDTGEILSTHRIEPERSYWRNQRRDPGRWPGSRATE